jgi:hypothetical protein
MPTFDFMPLVWWGLPLAAAPLLIHLINLLRPKRVRWAAMEFLLASQRKYRTQVRLRQLLLLALRTLAVLGIVLALAQPRWRHAIGRLLGGGTTSHLVLLDDSYSMGDLTPDPAARAGTADRAFDRGRRVVERLAAELAAAPQRHELAVGLFSQGADTLLVGGEPATPRLAQRVRDELATVRVSAGAVGPGPALAGATTPTDAAARVVWLVSDFRARDWRAEEETAADLRRLSDAGVEIRLVDCGADAEAGAANLTLERLEPTGGIPASGVVLPMEVAIHNDSGRPFRDVPLQLLEDGQPRPGITIGEIPAGGTAVRRFDVRFSTAGSHAIEARLPPDALPADDARATVVDVMPAVDVLVVDGDPRGGRTGDAFYVATALAPGSGAPTGLRPRIEAPAALATLDLAAFDSIWVLDVERLEPAEISALETYARDGGGVVFFCGPRTTAEFVNQRLYRDGAGLFPVPLAGPVDLPAGAAQEAGPDLVAEDHPVVAVLAGQRNPLLDAVRVERVMAVDREHREAEAGTRRLLSLRSGAALAVERPFGSGIVATVLTSAAPTWNTWARGNPSWVVVMLELESHLARARHRPPALEVGDDVAVRLEQGADEIAVDFLVPPDGTVVRQTAAADADGGVEARLPGVTVPGVYGARWRRLDGVERERQVAVNVAPEEGRLERVGRGRLDAALTGVAYRYEPASALQPDAGGLAGVPLARPLLYALFAVLALEQLVAFAAGYHPVSSRSAAARPTV